MTIEKVKNLAKDLIEKEHTHFVIEQKIFDETKGLKKYNQIIDKELKNKKDYGVYIWEDNNGEIIYIGMAGKVNNDGSMAPHSLNKRLKASRVKDKQTNKDIQTNAYLSTHMKNHDIEKLNMYILFTKENIPPAYLESILLYNYYTDERKLPRLNNSF
jgi:hypothetical protein